MLLENKALGALILDQALQKLNQEWPRTSKGGLTAAQLKQALPSWRTKTTRSSFYKAACFAIQGIQG